MATVPEAVTTLSGSTALGTDSAVDLTWTAPADGGSQISGYNVFYSQDNGSTFTQINNSENVPGSPYTLVIPFRGGLSFPIKITAVNAAGEGPPSNVVSPTVSGSAPSTPQTVTATQQAGWNVVVAWTAPASSPEPTQYEIEYRAGPSSFQNAVVSAENTQYTVDGSEINAGAQYEVRVRGINALGNGEWSGSVYATAADVPNVIDALTAAPSATQQRAVDLGIPVPPANYSPILSYDVEIHQYSGYSSLVTQQNYTDQPANAGASFTKTISLGMIPGATYYFRARFLNALGAGPWAQANSATSSSVPSNPESFSASATDGSWTLTWNAPSDTGGESLTGYELEEAADAAFSSPATFSASAGQTSYSYAVSVADATRYFRIRAVNSLGASAWAETTGRYDTPPTEITYTVGAGGSGGNGNANGSAGGATTLAFDGVSLTANGGSGGGAGSGGAGGSATGGQTAAGGSGGAGGGGDTGGGGGGGLNQSNGYADGQGPFGFNNGGGGIGAPADNFNGLFDRLDALSVPTSGGGAGSSNNDPAEPGGNATGFGAGGGGGGWYGSDGGDGLYGGGGGGAAEEGGNRAGGNGGAGCVVLEFVTSSATTQHLLTSGSTYTLPNGTTTVRAWVVGGGGGGGGAGGARGASGGGGAGGIAYYEWTL